MRSNQIQFTYRNNLFYMLWEILTAEEDIEAVRKYIKERIFKQVPYREELRKVKGGWHYAVYVE